MIKPAKGTTGCLIPSMDGRFYFRVYSEIGKFVDYEIHHSDLLVTICDEDSAFYSGDFDSAVLDHSPDTLGIKNES